jgi:O-antigen/teichoic acid export membrane protein
MLALVGKELFTVAFGAQWAEAGVYTQVLSVWMLFWFISAPMTRVVNIWEKTSSYCDGMRSP